MTTWDLICTDLARSEKAIEPMGTLRRALFILAALPKVKSLAVVGFRVSHALGARHAFLGAATKLVTQVITGADVAYQAQIGPGLALLHPSGVVIAGRATVGARCTIHQGTTIGDSPTGAPTVGDDVNIGPGARLLGAIVVADNIHIGANAVVTHSFEDGGVVVAGVPARVIRRR